MPTGTTDFNQPLATDPTSPGQSSAQVAGRILMGGGANSASGRWIWASGFESGLNEWSLSSTPATLDSVNVYQGANSAKLTTTAVINSSLAISKPMYATGTRNGIEFYFSIEDAFIPREIRVQIIASGLGPNKDRNRIGYIVVEILNINSGNLYYENNGVKTLIANINRNIFPSPKYFHYLKFVFDTSKNEYVRVFFDDLAFDLPGVAGYETGGGTYSYLQFYIFNKTTTAAANSIYIDNVIITADEP